jgi:hypothetical protein
MSWPWTNADSLADAVAALRDHAPAIEGEASDAWYAEQLDTILDEHDD